MRAPSTVPIAIFVAAAPAAGAGGGAGLAVVLLIIGLLIVVGGAVKLFDLHRKREADAVYLQAQVSDALLRDQRLFGLPISTTADLPLFSRGPARLRVTGQVPSPEMRDTVLKLVEDEAMRVRSDVTIEDRTTVDPSLAAHVA